MRTKNKKQAPKEANQWGPNSVKDSNKATSKLAVLRVDERGADLNLVAVFSIIDLLIKTPIRNAANNPIIEPVPPTSSTRHGHPCRTNTPPDEAKNHRPTDDHIKNTVILALASSSFTHHSSLADQFQQVDHATRTWTKKLPRTFNPASKTQPGKHHGIHHPSHAEHAPTTLTGPPIPAHPPHLTRIATPARQEQEEDSQLQSNYNALHRDYKRNRDDDDRHTHKTIFLPAHPSRPSTPPTALFLNRSARSTEEEYASPYDSGYDSTASGPRNPPSSRSNSDVDDQANRMINRIYDNRVATTITATVADTTKARSAPPLLKTITTLTHTICYYGYEHNSTLTTIHTQCPHIRRRTRPHLHLR